MSERTVVGVVKASEILDAYLDVERMKAVNTGDWAFREQAGGIKADAGKAPWDLLPYDALHEVVKVLKFGVSKYAARNWEDGIEYSRVFAALQRHVTAWWGGEELDPETGMNHLAHTACCALFLLAFRVRGMDQHDNRPGAGKSSVRISTWRQAPTSPK